MASSQAKSQRSECGIHDMISKLTDRLVSLSQGTPEHENNHHAHHDADPGVRIITLAGENKGAAMKGTSLDELVDTQGRIYNDENLMSAYTTSNYQAVNNSIMLEGKYSAEDPGVHIIISNNLDDDSSSDDSDSDSEESDNEDRKGKKGKKKESKKKKDGKKKEKDDDSSSDDSDSDSEESDNEDRKGKKGKKKESKKNKDGKKKEKDGKKKEKDGKKKEKEKTGTSEREQEHHSESEKEEKGKHSE